MTPEVGLDIKSQIWERIGRRLIDVYLAEHAEFLEARWEWVTQLGMVDPEVDLMPPSGRDQGEHKGRSQPFEKPGLTGERLSAPGLVQPTANS